MSLYAASFLMTAYVLYSVLSDIVSYLSSRSDHERSALLKAGHGAPQDDRRLRRAVRDRRVRERLDPLRDFYKRVEDKSRGQKFRDKVREKDPDAKASGLRRSLAGSDDRVEPST
jgi:hypothetical protein